MTTLDRTDLAFLILRTALNLYQKSPTDLPAPELATVENQARLQYEIEALVLASPEAIEVIVPTSQLEMAVAEIQNHYTNEEQFQQDLVNHGMDLENFRQALYRQLRVETVLKRVGARAEPVNETDAKIYYYMHPDQFQQPELRTTRHILITINPEYPENTRRAARKRLFNIAIRLRRRPQTFAEQAKKHSECTTALEGGLLGAVSRGQLYPELDEALFSLQLHEISKIVESPLGFHLLLCEEIHPAGLISFEEATPDLLATLQERRREFYQNHWLQQLSMVSENLAPQTLS